jgi:hypothetical protein
MVFHSFRTHTGEVVTGERLQAACKAVAQWQEENARAIRREDTYASHVTEEQKEQALSEYLAWAEKNRKQENLHNFSVWQRVNTELTGECVALLP